MPGCVLRVSGAEFDVDAFLAHSTLLPYRVHRKGDLGHRSRRFTNSGLSLDVSSADALAAEITDAITFLSEHEAELQRLRDFHGVTNICLDFGHYLRDVAAQFDYLPPDLLFRAGSLGIGIELSLYAASSESTR